MTMPESGSNGGGVHRAADPGGIDDLAQALRDGSVTAQALVQRCLARIDEVEKDVLAWRELDADGALAAARSLDRLKAEGGTTGPLHGIPLAVKDIIDVAGLPTRCNSATLASAPAAGCDAAVVASLRAAGAIVLGKVHTTEFAFFDPSPARNPHNTAHTPGGSSSGSAAAVAAGMVPASLGSQTVASVNRPAAYCGIAAFKPSSGLTNTFGVTPLAPMYDTVGFYGRRTADAVAVFEAACPGHAREAGELPTTGLTAVRLRDPALAAASDAVENVMSDVARKLASAGHVVTERDSPVSFEGLRELQWETFLYEMSRVHRQLLEAPEEQVGQRLREAIAEGIEIEDRQYQEQRARIDAARRELFAALADADCVLWPAAPGTAPNGLAWTGDPRFISPWTALGGPVVTVPAGFDAASLPVGVLLAGSPGSDRRIARVAKQLVTAFEV